MGSGGEAEYTDAIRVNMPRGRMGPSDAHGLLRVLKVCRVLGIVLGKRHTVLDQHTGDSDGVQPGANLRPFEIVGKDAIASTGEDDDRGAGVDGISRRIDSERRLADIGQMHQALSRHQPVRRLGDVSFGSVDLGGFRRAVGPEGERYLLRRSKRRNDKQNDGEKERCAHGNIVMPLHRRRLPRFAMRRKTKAGWTEVFVPMSESPDMGHPVIYGLSKDQKNPASAIRASAQRPGSGAPTPIAALPFR